VNQAPGGVAAAIGTITDGAHALTTAVLCGSLLLSIWPPVV